MEETALEVGPLTLAAQVDSIRRDQAGRIQYHYTILDFAARWKAGEPIAGSDVTEAVWARLDALEGFDLWREAHRVIAIAARLVAG